MSCHDPYYKRHSPIPLLVPFRVWSTTLEEVMSLSLKIVHDCIMVPYLRYLWSSPRGQTCVFREKPVRHRIDCICSHCIARIFRRCSRVALFVQGGNQTAAQLLNQPKVIKSCMVQTMTCQPIRITINTLSSNLYRQNTQAITSPMEYNIRPPKPSFA